MQNIGRMISSAYNGWLDPETVAQTGTVPTPGFNFKSSRGTLRVPKGWERFTAYPDGEGSYVNSKGLTFLGLDGKPISISISK